MPASSTAATLAYITALACWSMTRTATGTSARTPGRTACAPAGPAWPETAALAAVTMPACWPSSRSASTSAAGAGPAGEFDGGLHRTGGRGGGVGAVAHGRHASNLTVHHRFYARGLRRRPARTRAGVAGSGSGNAARQAVVSRPGTGTPLRSGGIAMGLLDRLFGRRRHQAVPAAGVPGAGYQGGYGGQGGTRGRRAAARPAGHRALPVPAAHRAARADRAGARRGLRAADRRPAAAGAGAAGGRRPGR